MKITFLNQKGGVGKSTISVLLGGALKMAGYRVAFDDRDPQGSLTMWAQKIGNIPMLDECPDPEVTICDTPGRVDLQQEELAGFFRPVIQTSQRLIVVSEKSLFSTQATIPMIGLAKKWMPNGAKTKLLFNKVRPRTVTGRQDEFEMGADLGLPVLRNTLPLCAAYENVQTLGYKAVNGRNRERIFTLALEVLR